jgi:hypothetical protein
MILSKAKIYVTHTPEGQANVRPTIKDHANNSIGFVGWAFTRIHCDVPEKLQQTFFSFLITEALFSHPLF